MILRPETVTRLPEPIVSLLPEPVTLRPAISANFITEIDIDNLSSNKKSELCFTTAEISDIEYINSLLRLNAVENMHKACVKCLEDFVNKNLGNLDITPNFSYGSLETEEPKFQIEGAIRQSLLSRKNLLQSYVDGEGYFSSGMFSLLQESLELKITAQLKEMGRGDKIVTLESVKPTAISLYGDSDVRSQPEYYISGLANTRSMLIKNAAIHAKQKGYDFDYPNSLKNAENLFDAILQ